MGWPWIHHVAHRAERFDMKTRLGFVVGLVLGIALSWTTKAMAQDVPLRTCEEYRLQCCQNNVEVYEEDKALCRQYWANNETIREACIEQARQRFLERFFDCLEAERICITIRNVFQPLFELLPPEYVFWLEVDYNNWQPSSPGPGVGFPLDGQPKDLIIDPFTGNEPGDHGNIQPGLYPPK